jgi:hypothetical protein
VRNHPARLLVSVSQVRLLRGHLIRDGAGCPPAWYGPPSDTGTAPGQRLSDRLAAATSLDEAVCTTTRRRQARRACPRASAERRLGRDCPCSVREQAPTSADSNEEHAGNLAELREVPGASWSLSLRQAGLKMLHCSAALREGRLSAPRLGRVLLTKGGGGLIDVPADGSRGERELPLRAAYLLGRSVFGLPPGSPMPRRPAWAFFLDRAAAPIAYVWPSSMNASAAAPKRSPPARARRHDEL